LDKLNLALYLCLLSGLGFGELCERFRSALKFDLLKVLVAAFRGFRQLELF